MKFKYLKQNALLVIFGLSIALFLSEIFFRVGGLVLSKTINETKNYSYSQNNHTYRILCLGDSSTYGIGASDREKFSYPSQLQKILNERVPDMGFEVINLGLPGINSSQVYNRFRGNILKYKPDTIIVMVGINDPWNLEESNITSYYSGSIIRKLFLSAEFFLNKLKTYQFFKLIYINREVRTSIREQGAFDVGEQKIEIPIYNEKARSAGYRLQLRNPAKSNALYKVIENNIVKLSLIADEHHTNIIFMKYHAGGWGGPQKILYEVYDNLNVPVVDNEVVFNEAKKLKLSVRGPDGWHPNDFGYSLIAKNVYRKLVSLKLVNGEPVQVFEDE